ncbi:MAG: ATP-binding protein [Clostridia bacterium]|nr:ATP-binding protein [Clostridia bacterium]
MREQDKTLLRGLGLPADFIEALPGGFHLCEDDPENGYPFVYMSDRFLEILGWTREEIAERFGNRYAAMVHPEDLKPGIANYGDAEEGAVLEDRIFRMCGKHGWVWVASTAKPCVVGGKRCIQAIHSAVNTTVDRHERDVISLRESLGEAGDDIRNLKNSLDIIRSVAEVYICLYYIDMSDFSYIELGTTATDVAQVMGKRGDAREAFDLMSQYFVSEEYRETMREFTDVTTLNARLKESGTGWFSRAFIDGKAKWAEGTFIAAERDAGGNCLHAIWAVRDIQEQKKLELAYRDKFLTVQQERTAVVGSMLNVFYAIYYLDMRDLSFVEFGKTTEELGEFIGRRGDAVAAFRGVGMTMITEEYRDAFLAFTDITTLNERLADKDWIALEYNGVNLGWSEGIFIAADRNEDGSLGHVLFVARDINEQKNKEFSFRRELEETNDIVAGAEIGIWSIVLAEGEPPRMKANPKMRGLLALPETVTDEAEIYDAWFSRVKPEALDSVNASVAAMIAGEKNENTYLWTHPLLGDRYVRCGGVARKTERGTVLRGYHYDVTAEVQKERERQRADEKLHEILNAVSGEYHTIWLVDRDTFKMELIRSSGISTIRHAVARALALHDYKTSVRWYVDEYIVPEDRERVAELAAPETVLRETERSGVYTVNYRRTDESGAVGYHQMAFSRVEGFGFTLAFRDIDAMMREEQEKQQTLARALDAAEDANKAKSTFLFNMSHDIRTPMNAIIGYNRLIRKELTDPKLIDYEEKIEQSGGMLLSIINNVLDMARIESGKATLDEDIARAEDVTNAIESVFEPEAKKKGIAFLVRTEVEHGTVICDETKIKEIFSNLISNAIKYTPAGGRVSVVTDEIPGAPEGYARYRAVVSDNGIGMSSEFLPHLFDSFTRERNTTIGKVAGTGLGMSIVKKLVDLMHGTIEVESTPGEGTTFTVTLDHKIADGAALAARQSAVAADAAERLRGKTLLVAEDNDLNAEIVMEVLKERGISSVRAEDGVCCVAELERNPAGTFDAVLMDIQMPNMDGYKATRTIRRLGDPGKANIPIVAMTANAFEEDKKNAFAAGMNGHVAKPVDMTQLMAVLTEVLNTGD